MKKIKIIALFLIVLLITACDKVEKTDYTPNDGIIVKYIENTYTFQGLKKYQDDFYVIEVYSDRTIKYGKKESTLKEKKLSISQYNKIATLALSEKFYQEFFADVETKDVDPEEVDLTKNISSGEDKEKGIDSYVYIYSDAGGVIGVGGQDPDNEMYNSLVKLLKKYGK